MAILRQKKSTPMGDSYQTPPWFKQYVETEFRPTLDPCPCNPNFDPIKDVDGLTLNWDGHTVFVNPPYSQILPWVIKALASRCTTIMLLPARTDTKWFRLLMDAHAEIRFLQKRVDFISAVDGKKIHPAEASLLVVIRNS